MSKGKLPKGVEELPSGRYRAMTWNRYSKRKGPSRTFDDQFAAAAWKERIELDMYRAYKAQGLDVEAPVKPVTFATFALSWAPIGAPSTRANRRYHARALAAAWPTEKITDITQGMVEAMLYGLETRSLSARTREGRLATLRALFTAAVKDGYRVDNPTAGVKAPKTFKDAGRHRNITEVELAAIKEHLPEWTHAAVLLSRDSGLRIAEVCGLPWHRVDLLHRRVTVSDVVLLDGSIRTTPKGGEVLTVALTPRTVDALRNHSNKWPGGPQDRVFRDPRRNRPFVKTARLRELWGRAREAAGVTYPAPRWHDLRHSRGHALARAGAPIQVIQSVLRHANVNTTRKYMGAVPLADQERWMRAADELPGEPVAV